MHFNKQPWKILKLYKQVVGCPRLQEEAEFFARSIDGKLFMGNGNGVWASVLEMQDRPHQICMHFNSNWWHIWCIWITGGAWPLYQTSKSVRLAIYKWLCNPLWASHTSFCQIFFPTHRNIFLFCSLYMNQMGSHGHWRPSWLHEDMLFGLV